MTAVAPLPGGTPQLTAYADRFGGTGIDQREDQGA
jgi:hypothetical protein